MNELNYPTPDCPAELLRINEVQRELESPMAFAELVEDCQAEFDPTVAQGLNAAIMIVSKLARFHFDQLQSGELDAWGEEMWRTDYDLLKKALGLLKQVDQG